MAKRDADSGKESSAFSDSAEIFEDIFKEATQLVEKRKQRSHRSTDRERPGPEKKTPRAERKSVKPGSTTSQPLEKDTAIRSQTIIKSETEYKARKPASILKISILLVLLLIVGGAFLYYFGVVEISPVLDLFGLGKKEVVKAPPPKRAPAKTPGKARSAPAKMQAVEKVASSTPPPSSVPKKVETPAPTPTPAKQTVAQVPPPVLSPAPVAAPVQHQPAPAPVQPAPAPAQPAPKQVQPAPTPQPAPQAQVKSKQELARQGVRPPAVQTHPSVRHAESEAGLLQSGWLPYPYSIYLGSYQTLDRAKKATSLYRQEGLTVYWARVDLGEKGTWYRIFTGYFRSEAEASGFIAKKQLKEAEVKRTKYSVLIGVYTSREEAQQKSGALLNLGFPTYVIPEAQAKFRVYSGAFVTKNGADLNVAELASKGVRSQAVER
jgi:cell division septation protein DedD